MNKIITVLILILSINLDAQEAASILERLSNNTKSYKNITVNFNLTYINTSQNINGTVQNGSLTIESEKFLLKINEQTIINNGEVQWIYLEDLNEVQIIKHDKNENTLNPNDLLNIYKKGYKNKYIGRKIKENKSLYIINLFPEESNDFIKIELEINEKNYELHTVTLFDKNGGEYIYSISYVKNNIDTTNLFTFNPKDYPNIEIIDLR